MSSYCNGNNTVKDDEKSRLPPRPRPLIMTTQSDEVIDPYQFNSLPTVIGPIVLGLILLTVVYLGLYLLFLQSETILWGLLPPAADEYCENELQSAGEVCSRSDLFAFQMSSGIAILACGLLGTYTWVVSRNAHKQIPQTPEGRLFGYLKEGETLAAFNFTFQLWDLVISMLIPEHRTAIMITHHIMACCVSWMSINNQVLHYYGIFFLGLCEFSSIFLVVVDLAKFFPPEPNTVFDMIVNSLCAPMFAVTFIVTRVVLWWKVSYLLWNDCHHVLKNNAAIVNQIRPGRAYTLYMFLILNLPLGILQLYWFGLIVKEAQNVLLSA